MKIFTILFLLCLWSGLSFGQDPTSVKNALAQMNKRDSAVQARLKADIETFKKEEGKAYLLISNPEYHRHLRKYSADLRDKLFKCYKNCPESADNRRVLGLLTLPKYMKDSLYLCKDTELEVRAGLGDKSAQQRIIKMYLDFLKKDIKTDAELYQYFYEPKLDLALLIYIGTPESIKIYIKGMATNDIYEDTQTAAGHPPNKISVFMNLLASYSGRIGGAPVVSGAYYQKFLYVEQPKDFDAKHKAYFRELEKFFAKKYGVTIKITAPFLILGQDYTMQH